MKKTVFSLIIVSLVLAGSIAVFAQTGQAPQADPGVTPDSKLYGLDLAFERLRDLFAFSDVGKVKVALAHAEERLAEAKAMVDKKKADLAGKAAERAADKLSKALDRVESAKAKGKDVTDTARRVEEATSRHITVLQGVLEKVPEQAKDAIQRAIDVSQRGHDKALEMLGKPRGPQGAGQSEELGGQPTPPPAGSGTYTPPPSSESEALASATVTYRNGTFSPNSVTVQSGGTVTFRNEDADSLWVASVPHPVHTGLSGFDALRGIGQGESYNFTFTRSGTFGYHNHLSPNSRGTVIVQ